MKLKIAAIVLGCSLSATLWAAEAPTFNAEKLNVPRVDSGGQVGAYQEGVLSRLPNGDFRLDSVEALDVGQVYRLPGIMTAEIRQSSAVPVAVLLRVAGTDFSCDHISPLRFDQRLTGSQIDVVISSKHLRVPAPGNGCTNESRPFRLTVPLDVYGLPAGTYTVKVNGGLTAQFTLTTVNRYPDDCHQTFEIGVCAAN